MRHMLTVSLTHSLSNDLKESPIHVLTLISKWLYVRMCLCFVDYAN